MRMDSLYACYGSDPVAMGRALLEASGASALFKPGVKVALKPNLVVAKPASSGATTHVGFAEAVIAFARECGVTDIRVIESSWVGDDTVRAFKAGGWEEMSRRLSVPLFDLKRDKAVTVGGVRVCAAALEADVLVNLPVLKAHCQTGLTCALKNMKGCIPDAEKRRYHALGLHKPIAQLSKVIRPHLTLVDGICGDLTFEEGGTPVPMNRAFLGFDPVLTDAYAARLLGYDVSDIPNIGLAEALGAGSASIGDDTVLTVGEGGKESLVEDAARGAGLVRSLARNVKADAACSACYGSLIHALHRASEDGRASRDSIVIGQGYRGMNGTELGIGDCCRGFDRCVRGCPPDAKDIYSAL